VGEVGKEEGGGREEEEVGGKREWDGLREREGGEG
jgi:hypothetical protein